MSNIARICRWKRFDILSNSDYYISRIFVQKIWFLKNSKKFVKKDIGGEMLKKKTLKKIFSVCLSVVVIICVCVYFYIRNRNLKNEKNLLSLADNIISEEIVTPKADGTTISSSENYLEENIY